MHSSHHEGRSGQAADASVSSSLRVKAEPVRGGAETNEKYAVRGAEAADLLNKLSQLHERIDLVLTKNASRTPAPKAKVVNDRQVDRTATGQWPSDHAGVAATVYP